MDSLLFMPNGIMSVVFGYLQFRDLRMVLIVCKDWNHVVFSKGFLQGLKTNLHGIVLEEVSSFFDLKRKQFENAKEMEKEAIRNYEGITIRGKISKIQIDYIRQYKTYLLVILKKKNNRKSVCCKSIRSRDVGIVFDSKRYTLEHYLRVYFGNYHERIYVKRNYDFIRDHGTTFEEIEMERDYGCLLKTISNCSHLLERRCRIEFRIKNDCTIETDYEIQMEDSIFESYAKIVMRNYRFFVTELLMVNRFDEMIIHFNSNRWYQFWKSGKNIALEFVIDTKHVWYFM